MPSVDEILANATGIANDWKLLAALWHLLAAAVLIGIATRQPLSNRLTGYLLVLPLVSVSVLAWISGNPFNGAVFAALALLLRGAARGLPDGITHIAATSDVVVGLTLVGFAWVYPHFLDASSWRSYLLLAPIGLLPCPTLAGLIGITFIVGTLRTTRWVAPLAVAGLAYGALGFFWLGVTIDVGLIAGATVALGKLVAQRLRARPGIVFRKGMNP